MEAEVWRPTASIRMLQARARLTAVVREFFVARGFLEVETPILSAEFIDDGWIEPFVASGNSSHPADGSRFLQPSPELHMKRLLAAGAPSCFQFSRVFRAGEIGRHHNPEFTMLEWYALDQTEHDQMSFVESLLRHVIDAAIALPSDVIGPRGICHLATQEFQRLSYAEAFASRCHLDIHTADVPRLAQVATDHGLLPPSSLGNDIDDWRNFLLAELIEPTFDGNGPVFLHDYPASQAALAKTDPGPPAIARRFELYVAGLELCNGYWELTEPKLLEQRMADRQASKAAQGHAAMATPRTLLDAQRNGLPESAGVALGFDRLLMAALGHDDIRHVIAFPTDRA